MRKETSSKQKKLQKTSVVLENNKQSFAVKNNLNRSKIAIDENGIYIKANLIQV